MLIYKLMRQQLPMIKSINSSLNGGCRKNATGKLKAVKHNYLTELDNISHALELYGQTIAASGKKI